MIKFLLIFSVTLYTMIGCGTFIGFNEGYKRACPNESFTAGPALAGVLWPLFAGARIAGLEYGPVSCGNKW